MTREDVWIAAVARGGARPTWDDFLSIELPIVTGGCARVVGDVVSWRLAQIDRERDPELTEHDAERWRAWRASFPPDVQVWADHYDETRGLDVGRMRLVREEVALGVRDVLAKFLGARIPLIDVVRAELERVIVDVERRFRTSFDEVDVGRMRVAFIDGGLQISLPDPKLPPDRSGEPGDG